MQVKLHGGTNFIYTIGGLQPYLVDTGVWYSFTFSLAGKTAGGWVGSAETNFEAALRFVTWINVDVSRNSTTNAHSFLLDNFFIDRLPAVRSTAVAPVPPQLTIDYVRTGGLFGIAASAALDTGVWTNVYYVTATNRPMPWVDPDAAGYTQRFYRFFLPDHTP